MEISTPTDTIRTLLYVSMYRHGDGKFDIIVTSAEGNYMRKRSECRSSQEWADCGPQVLSIDSP
jgi:hypothetical protein